MSQTCRMATVQCAALWETGRLMKNIAVHSAAQTYQQNSSLLKSSINWPKNACCWTCQLPYKEFDHKTKKGTCPLQNHWNVMRSLYAIANEPHLSKRVRSACEAYGISLYSRECNTATWMATQVPGRWPNAHRLIAASVSYNPQLIYKNINQQTLLPQGVGSV